ncbi:MAG: hypothetical protein ACXVCI_15905 [Bdellovibrionota bacterium]
MSINTNFLRFNTYPGPAPGQALEGKPHAMRAPHVLVVDGQQFFRSKLAALIKRKFSIQVEEAGSLQDAATAIRDRQFDIVIFGNPEWEEGVALYIELLSQRRSPCQFILFLEDQSEPSLYFSNLLKVVPKPDFEALIATADWSAIPG